MRPQVCQFVASAQVCPLAGAGNFNEVDRGGHFAAWEEPELFATEVRAAFNPLR
jgi:pimeloyl-ACP methyl ester carboxylesterase